jgi:hypothetical protein
MTVIFLYLSDPYTNWFPCHESSCAVTTSGLQFIINRASESWNGSFRSVSRTLRDMHFVRAIWGARNLSAVLGNSFLGKESALKTFQLYSWQRNPCFHEVRRSGMDFTHKAVTGTYHGTVNSGPPFQTTFLLRSIFRNVALCNSGMLVYWPSKWMHGLHFGA